MDHFGEPGGLSGASRRELAILFGDGARTVTVEAAADALNVSPETAARRLSALASRGWLGRICRGMHFAVPVDAQNPAAWTEDSWYLADLVWKPCYIGGWSAANHWSLTDQVFRSTIVMMAQRIRRVEQELAGGPTFLVRHVDPERLTWGLVGEWRHDRRILVSTPERTVADLLSKPALGGGIRHSMEILDSLLADTSVDSLVEIVKRLGNGAGLKRLGYLLEQLGHSSEAIGQPLTTGVPLLDPALPAVGPRSPQWCLRVNADVSA
ncbi:type IV toxin-antitoxin system AbiEi family antitoxin domain-containing protein [Candidatus Poriferisodalis sp.]|uniref:type IV toxin-antitoxin system AbiEi family antitoxin domain-containing protein n=1 Tax=Candidatus Poriferisodalis sp. TaxID=3101277 RepID=UPI003C6EF8AA